MAQYYVIKATNTLQHHGIQGQKWGVRRFQNPDGTWTEAGKERYGESTNDRQSTIKKETSHKFGITKYQNKDGSLTEDGEKLYNKNLEKGKYDKYKNTNLTKEDQFKAQYNKDKLKKALLITGGVVLTGAAVYAGKRYFQNNIDSVLKSGTKLQTIMNSDKIDLGRNFYTSINGLDKLRYGAIGAQQGFGINDVYKHTLEVGSNLKIASNKSGIESFSKLMTNNKEFSNEVKDHILQYKNKTYLIGGKKGATIRKAIKEIETGKIGKNTYEIFNTQLAQNGVNDKVKKEFYDSLKKSGYAGVRDINDMKYTNYWSINPAIIFDGQNHIKNVKVSELTEKHYKTGLNMVTSQFLLKSYAPIAATIGGYKLVNKTIKTLTEPQKVEQYRKEHPDSKMSYDEILKTLSTKK